MKQLEHRVKDKTKMGIKNLLPTLKSIERHKHVREFSGQTVGIDALCWMHQGAYQYAKDLVNSKIKLGYCSYTTCDKLITYCLQKLRMLQVNGLRCIVVFDGAPLHMKQRVEDDRKRLRRESQIKAV